MNREDCKNAKQRFKVLLMEMTRYDKIILTFCMVVFFGLGIFSEALCHMLYDAITEHNQPDVGEKVEIAYPDFLNPDDQNDFWSYVVDTNTDNVYVAIQTWPNIGFIPARSAEGEQITRSQLGGEKYVEMNLSQLRRNYEN